jgi:hypothetical protein
MTNNSVKTRRWTRGRTLSRRARVSVVVALAATFGGLLTAGVAVASIPDSHGVIHGCYVTRTGALSVIDTARVHRCARGSKSLTWNHAGPAGTARDAGTVVSVNQGGPSFYTEGLKGWRSVTSPRTGVYCLTPDAKSTIANTTLLLSGGSPGAGGEGFITWGGYCSASPLSLAVDTTDISGNASNGIPFTAVIP